MYCTLKELWVSEISSHVCAAVPQRDGLREGAQTQNGPLKSRAQPYTAATLDYVTFEQAQNGFVCDLLNKFVA